MRCQPVSKGTLGVFLLAFLKEKIQPARSRVTVQLPVPKRLVARAEPLGKAQKFFGRQAVDCRFDLLYPIHKVSLPYTHGPIMVHPAV